MLVSFGTSALSPELSNLNSFLSGNPYNTTVSLGSRVAHCMSSSWAGNGKCCVTQLCSSCTQSAPWVRVQRMSSVPSNARTVLKARFPAKPVFLRDPYSTGGNEANVCQLERAKESLGGRAAMSPAEARPD